MTLLSCELEGLKIIQPAVFGDARGWFTEIWNDQRYRDAGIGEGFVQDNLSYSRHGTLRGLHFQNPFPQGKLVSVLRGQVLDVVVDLRRSSPTFRRWEGILLSADNRRQLYVPPGFAHGFLVLSDEVLFHYKCTARYSPKDEMTLRWDDPEIGIRWPVAEPVISNKDAAAPCLRDIPPERLFD